VADRIVGYCCPAAVKAYPAPCSDHGQDRPDVVSTPGGWCAPDGDGWDMLPGPLCHFTIDDDGTIIMYHDPQTHARPASPSRGLLGDLWDALRSMPSWYTARLADWSRRTVYNVHRPTYIDGYSAHPGPAKVYCCHCSRGRTAVPWPCPPVLKVTPDDSP
jgi:hypothetical protein